MAISMGMPAVFAAEDDHGANAHSPSMSNETGSEPIENSNTSVDASAENEVVGEDIEATDDAKSTLPDAKDKKAVKKAQSESEKAVKSDEEKQSFLDKLPKWAFVVTIAVALMALGAAILLFRSRRKDRKPGQSRSDKKYVSKH